MAAVDNAEYAAYSKKFAKHWGDSEKAIGAPIALNKGETLALLSQLIHDLETVNGSLLTVQNDRQQGQKERDAARDSVHPVGKRARIALKSLAAPAGATGALPVRFPALNAAPADLLVGLTDIKEVWTRVNGLKPEDVPAAALPLVITVELPSKTVESVTLAEYEARIGAFAAAVEKLAQGNADEARLRAERDQLIGRIKPILKDYRAVAAARLPAGHPLLKTLPTL